MLMHAAKKKMSTTVSKSDTVSYGSQKLMVWLGLGNVFGKRNMRDFAANCMSVKAVNQVICENTFSVRVSLNIFDTARVQHSTDRQ